LNNIFFWRNLFSDWHPSPWLLSQLFLKWTLWNRGNLHRPADFFLFGEEFKEHYIHKAHLYSAPCFNIHYGPYELWWCSHSSLCPMLCNTNMKCLIILVGKSLCASFDCIVSIFIIVLWPRILFQLLWNSYDGIIWQTINLFHTCTLFQIVSNFLHQWHIACILYYVFPNDVMLWEPWRTCKNHIIFLYGNII
jgi:hypothetical protein